MKTFPFTLVLILSLALTVPPVEAKNFVYPVPPPNDTSLNYDPSISCRLHKKVKVHRKIHSHHHAHPALKTATKKIVTAVKRTRSLHTAHKRSKPHRTTGIFLYYALPATACCGETWHLPKAACCAEPGVWHTSPYAIFEPEPGDFIYSATNDDAERSYDHYHELVVNGEIEDPEYY
jgi:hypothetical protein